MSGKGTVVTHEGDPHRSSRQTGLIDRLVNYELYWYERQKKNKLYTKL